MRGPGPRSPHENAQLGCHKLSAAVSQFTAATAAMQANGAVHTTSSCRPNAVITEVLAEEVDFAQLRVA
jgi:hypothetical protein